MFTTSIKRAATGASLAFLVAFAGPGSAAAQDSPLAGDWEGVISAQGAELPIVLHITTGDDGSLSIVMDSPAQGVFGLETTDVAFVDGTLSFSVPSVPGGGAYEGAITDDGDALDGNWTQATTTVELDFARVEP